MSTAETAWLCASPQVYLHESSVSTYVYHISASLNHVIMFAKY